MGGRREPCKPLYPKRPDLIYRDFWKSFLQHFLSTAPPVGPEGPGLRRVPCRATDQREFWLRDAELSKPAPGRLFPRLPV